MNYTFDADGNRATVTYPDGTVVSYGYNNRNQLASVAAGGTTVATYSYDANGNRTGKALANGTTVSYAYDDANRLLTVQHNNGGGPFARFDYTYDANGNRLSRTESGTGVPPVQDLYTYDPTDQITNVVYGTGRRVGYQYDPVGNRLQVTDNGSPITYSDNNLNEYTTVGGTNYTSDVAGNFTSDGVSTYAYDRENRLQLATSPTCSAVFTNDYRNRVVERRINGVGRILFYDGPSLIEERNASGVEQARYIHGAALDEILCRVTATNTVFYCHDGLGNVTALTDGTGALVERYTYDVFGTPSFFDATGNVLSASAYGNRFLFTGREYLAELGLYDYRNRMYSPSLGRFLQTDPLRFDAGDPNLYLYTRNGATTSSDPMGLVSSLYDPGPSSANHKRQILIA